MFTLLSEFCYLDTTWVEPIGWVDKETSGSCGEGREVTGERERGEKGTRQRRRVLYSL